MEVRVGRLTDPAMSHTRTVPSMHADARHLSSVWSMSQYGVGPDSTNRVSIREPSTASRLPPPHVSTEHAYAISVRCPSSVWLSPYAVRTLSPYAI
eukprot:2368327-Rhodomonas_salina.2